MPKKPSPTADIEKVEAYMAQLEHPLKPEIEMVREIIKKANPKISERIKWNAPSYYYKQDLVTFNLRAQQHVHLVFHHPHIVDITSVLLEGDYKDRRMIYFKSTAAVQSNQNELATIINDLVNSLGE